MGDICLYVANTLNNHVPGALAAGVSLWALLRIVEAGRATTGNFILAAFAAAMCAVCELPALAWAAATIACLFKSTCGKQLSA